MIRVGICDGDAMVRQLLPGTLGSDDVEVVAVYGSAEEMLQSGVDVDVWLVDSDLPGIDGRKATSQLIEADPEAIVVMLSRDGATHLAESLSAGAKAHVDKDATPDQLRTVIRTVLDGFAVVHPQDLHDVLRGSYRSVELLGSLRTDEADRQLIKLLQSGRSYDEISAALGLSVSGTKSGRRA